MQVQDDQRAASDPLFAQRTLTFNPVAAVAPTQKSKEIDSMNATAKAAVKAAAAAMASQPEFAHLCSAGPATLEAALAVADPGAQAALLKALRNDTAPGMHLSAEDNLDLLAKRRSAATGTTFAKSYAAILETDQGRALAEAVRWSSLPAGTQMLYAEHFGNIISEGVGKSAARDSNSALLALDRMALGIQKRTPRCTRERAFDMALQTDDGKRLYKMHSDSVALRESAKG